MHRRDALPTFILPDRFLALLSAFAPCFHAPTQANFTVLIAGWVHCLGRRTVTAVVLAARAVGDHHISVFHRFFTRAEWSLDGLGQVVFQLALASIPADQPLLLLGDDTLARKTRKRIALGSMHHDPLRSTRWKPFFAFGQVWVVLACDSACAARTTLEDRPANVQVISRLRLDAAHWTPPPSRRPIPTVGPWEVTFHDTKQFLSFEAPQNQAALAVRRTAPLALVVYDLVLLWAAAQPTTASTPRWLDRPWYRQKTTPSFLDLLTALRRADWRQSCFGALAPGPVAPKTLHRLAPTRCWLPHYGGSRG